MKCETKTKELCEDIWWQECWDEPDTQCFERWQMEPWQVGELFIDSESKLSKSVSPSDSATLYNCLDPPCRNTSTKRSASSKMVLLKTTLVTR